MAKSEANRHSYLELSVLPDLRQLVISPLPAILFSADLDDVIWSNAAGARLFGGKGVVDLLSIRLPERNPIMRQLHLTLDAMGEERSVVRGFRISAKAQPQLLQFEVARIELPGGETAIRVIHLDHENGKTLSEENLAADTVSSLEGFAQACAILDEDAVFLAASPGFEQIDLPSQILEELATTDEKLLKRIVDLDDGRTVALGFARLSTRPGRGLLVIAGEDYVTDLSDVDADHDVVDGEEGPSLPSKVDPEISQSGNAQYETVAPAHAFDSVIETDISSAAQVQPDVGPRIVPSLWDEQASGGVEPLAEETQDTGLDEFSDTVETSEPRDEIDAFEQATTTFPSDFSKAQVTSQLGEFSADEINVEVAQTDDDKIPESDNQPDAGDTSDDIPTLPARFAWAMDENRRFVSVSEDLAQWVGGENANLEGKTWSEVDQELALDEDGQVSSLLLKQNTWSSVSVLWPTGNTREERIAVELAALPVFGKDREFAGFRGFGKFPEALVNGGGQTGSEPKEATENDPVSNMNHDHSHDARDPSAEEDHAALIDDDASDDEPAIRLVPSATDIDPEDVNTPAPSNVLQFSRGSHAPREMTKDEQEAFSSLRERLSEFKQDSGSGNRAQKPGLTSKRPENAPDTSLLEKLPVAVFVYRDEEILFANQHFLQATDFTTLDDLQESRSASQIIGTMSSDPERSPSMLFKRDETRISINPVLHTVPWEGEKAALLSFALPSDKPNALAKVELSRLQEIQNILDTTNDGIVMMEEDGTVISINGPAEALFGVEFDDATGSPFEKLFAAESEASVGEYLAKVRQSGVNRLINDGAEAIAQEAGGGYIPVFLTVTRLESSGKLCAVLRDITSWKKTEEELVQSRRKAEHSSEQKSEFLAQVSHEIRTPLNAIIGFSDVMIEERFGPIGSNRYKEYLRDIKRSGAHVLEIVNGLLDLARIEAGKLDLSFEAVDLNELVTETVALLQPEANINRTIIRTSLSRSVPKVVADPRSIRQIVLNLVSNAIKYSLNNSQVVVSTVYEDNGEVALRVRDTGTGMTREQIARAMEPFEQAHDIAERGIQGSGLGLPLTKALVEANRAFFEVESEPGLGTIAHVQFPVQRVLSE